MRQLHTNFGVEYQPPTAVDSKKCVKATINIVYLCWITSSVYLLHLSGVHMYSYNTIGKAHMTETWYESRWLWPRIWQHIKTRTLLWEQITILLECWINVYQWDVMHNSIWLLLLALSEKRKLCNLRLWVFRQFIAWIALSRFLWCLVNQYEFILSVMIL